MPAQRIVRSAMATGAALGALFVPRFPAIQPAHTAMMRDMACNPGVI
jgi:hypothetical protein